jgi:putative hydrolase of the HAD superfamily
VHHFFDAILISEVEQVRKPHPAIFERALQRLRTTAEEAVYVGDHPEADVSGAKGAGLKAIWKRNPYWPAPEAVDAVIEELDELPAVIKRL